MVGVSVMVNRRTFLSSLISIAALCGVRAKPDSRSWSLADIYQGNFVEAHGDLGVQGDRLFWVHVDSQRAMVGEWIGNRRVQVWETILPDVRTGPVFYETKLQFTRSRYEWNL